MNHYHDGSGLECDAVVHLRNGAYGSCEACQKSEFVAYCNMEIVRKMQEGMQA